MKEFTDRYGIRYAQAEEFGNGSFWESEHGKCWIPGTEPTISQIIAAHEALDLATGETE